MAPRTGEKLTQAVGSLTGTLPAWLMVVAGGAITFLLLRFVFNVTIGDGTGSGWQFVKAWGRYAWQSFLNLLAL